MQLKDIPCALLRVPYEPIPGGEVFCVREPEDLLLEMKKRDPSMEVVGLEEGGKKYVKLKDLFMTVCYPDEVYAESLVRDYVDAFLEHVSFTESTPIVSAEDTIQTVMRMVVQQGEYSLKGLRMRMHYP